MLLVGDHPVLREDLKDVLARAGFDLVGEARPGKEAVRMAREHHPDIALLNVQPFAAEGLETVRAMIEDRSCEQIVMLAGAAAGHAIGGASAPGAEDYLLRARVVGRLTEALFAAGEPESAPSFARDPLTPRERQVLRLIALGKSTREIAAELNVTFKTAETHRGNIMAKLDLHRTADLVRYAIRRGLVEP